MIEPVCRNLVLSNSVESILNLTGDVHMTTFHRIATKSLLLIVVVSMQACQSSTAPSSTPPTANNLTHGAVQLKLQKGVTTQNDIVEAFGAPNNTTIDGDGREAWTYRRHATVTTGSGTTSYFNILVFGTQTSSGGGSSSSQSMTLIIKFGPEKKVSDFQSMATSF